MVFFVGKGSIKTERHFSIYLGLILVLSLALTNELNAQLVSRDYSTLQAEFWVEQYKFPGLGDPREYASDDIYSNRIEELLEQARIHFSGMIFGYSFTYTPSDNRRQVAEIFEIEPIHQILWGDPGLEYLETRINESDVFMRFRYFTKDFEQARLQSWERIDQVNSQGLGTAFYGPRASVREESFTEAIKQAIRNYARTIIATKPREITGIFVLTEAPRSYIVGADFNTEVKIRLQIDSVLRYQNF